MTNSLWKAQAQLPSFETLEGDLKTDVLIVGGGLAGLLCAYLLAEEGVNYALIEADHICAGVTGNTTAKITAQHGLIYSRLLTQLGADRARMYLEANQAALNRYAQLCRQIDCDFERKDAYVYSLDDAGKLERELRALARLGAPGEFVQTLPLPFPTQGAVRFKNQAQFHPLKFAAAIASGLRIYEHTRAVAFAPGHVLTDRGRIVADQIIVATHFPLLNKHGSYFLKLYQHRSYVLALEGTPDVDGMYVDESGTGLSFRNHGDLLLLGGGAHRTGKPGDGWTPLNNFAAQHYPGAREVCRWATQDCMSLDGVPYIGHYSRRTPRLYAATGFNKWGITSSMVSAMLLSALVQGREQPWAPVFSPSRTMLRPQLLGNIWEATVNLLTPTAPRCPHMGCALKWNPRERSWDCPCHGSRFGEEGALMDGPATGNLPNRPPR